jgi:HAMP domain-containing protein
LYTLSVFWFSAIALVITGLFALASWFWIERPALRRTRIAAGRSADR